MQKNWYILYTKPKWEKKVAASLWKKKIENFFPLNYKQISSYSKVRMHREPLFESYVFVNIFETEFEKVKSVYGVLNFVYWKGKPAIIQEEEIEVIKEFSTDHQNIKLEKTKVNVNDVAKVIDGSKYSMSGNLLTVKNTMVKVNLPSLGITLVADVETETMHTELSFGKRDLILQS
ncbi:MAG: UpxY family transcription antiterminator [Ginsengibacter sp.]|jgi:transcription antitermination factor NusG